ncbi:MAG: anaerobic ribonucleoside-triphosphate reductase, partial [Cetobacterium somerae]
MITVIKKDMTTEGFDSRKIIKAINTSAKRVGIKLGNEENRSVVQGVLCEINHKEEITVAEIHNIVERVLDKVNAEVAKSYKDYRNYKQEFGIKLMMDIEGQVKRTLNEVDRENSNSNTRYISTKRTEIAQTFAKEMYQKMYLNPSVLNAIKDGYIYIHDLKDMLLPQFNCCLSDVATILNGGFELEGVTY